jgi:hypothetical protein
MAAGEDQPQALVGHARDHGRLRVRVGRHERRELGDAGLQRAPAPQPVDRAVARDGDHPRGGIARDAGLRPARERRRKRVLDRLLGDVPVADGADQGRDRPPELLAEQALDGARCQRLAQDAARSPVAVAARAAYAS